MSDMGNLLKGGDILYILNINLAAEFTDKYRYHMASTQNDRTFKKGSFIFIEGDEDTGSVFLVKKGRVTHVCNSPRLSSALQDAGEGDFFGFISAFSGRPRLSSAMAVEDTVAVQIDSERLFRMLGDKTAIAMKIMHSYSHSLQKYDNVLMGIKPISLLYPQSMSLLRLGEYYMENGNKLLADYIFNRYIQLFPDSDNLSDAEQYICDMEGPIKPAEVSETEKGELIYSDGAVIFCEYEPGDNLYFVEEGRVKITKQNKNRDMLLAVLGKGEIFGELALLTDSPRSATAVSFGGARITPVDMDMFRRLLPESPDLIRKIITSISHRLWFNHVRLSQMSYRKPVTRLFAFLETKLMEDGVSLGRKTPHQLQFGLDELIEMNELSAAEYMDEINELVSSHYLSFNFGTITVLNPKEFAAEVQMYKQRDRLSFLKRRTGVGREPVLPVDEQGSEEQYTASPDILEVYEEPPESIDNEVTEIIPELNSEDPMKRAEAVLKLGNLGEKAKASVPMLRERLGDNVKVIRKNAARSILNILPPGESFRVFSEALGEENTEIRSAAAGGLGEINVAEKSGIMALLIKTLQDKSPMVRSSAVRSLGSLGPDAESAVPRLIRLLYDTDVSVRMLAVNSLERISGHTGYINEVMEAVKNVSKNDADRFVKNSAKEALVRLKRKKKQK